MEQNPCPQVITTRKTQPWSGKQKPATHQGATGFTSPLLFSRMHVGQPPCHESTRSALRGLTLLLRPKPREPAKKSPWIAPEALWHVGWDADYSSFSGLVSLPGLLWRDPPGRVGPV
jgi:hypothetical protein